MAKPILGSPRRTHPLIWCGAIICTICTILVILLGIVVFIGYLATHPKIPYMIITQAHLNRFEYSQGGVLNTELTIWFKAENDNIEAQASFSDFIYELSFHGIKLTKLRNWDFNVEKNNSKFFMFDVKSESIALNPDLMEVVELSMNEDRIVFDLRGHTRARWRAGPIKSVKYWLHMNCNLQFHMDGSSIDFHSCSSKYK
ncbi:NDR1/HIN1-like protein 12 [Amaranthus tricolor]|uniref:NDR1/HIN1-like protein 12 n=1 Tax=Amaranthus tricolor TaxID=29722 RepID=UPI0025897D1C|nr:NDR1/HIN1-like protein 12 [Amaranthus tricolor]